MFRPTVFRGWVSSAVIKTMVLMKLSNPFVGFVWNYDAFFSTIIINSLHLWLFIIAILYVPFYDCWKKKFQVQNHVFCFFRNAILRMWCLWAGLYELIIIIFLLHICNDFFFLLLAQNWRRWAMDTYEYFIKRKVHLL